jgi:hypothetical protein
MQIPNEGDVTRTLKMQIVRRRQDQELGAS